MDYFILGFMGVLLSAAVLLIELDEDLKREISKLIKESEKESEKENNTDNE